MLSTEDKSLHALAELWSTMKNYIPAKDRADAASQFLEFLIDNGACDPDEEIDEMVGVCNVLDKAISLCKHDHADDDDDDDFNEFTYGD